MFISLRECLLPVKPREMNEEVVAKLHGLIENLEADNEKRLREAESYQSQVIHSYNIFTCSCG